ncbi:hypothetical protein TCAL_15754 [Tigriopus californicus]|uniref:Metalloendopeptidase n=2 Tax=Tigriopus californicus TaxID=6832 RepID=A0A553P7N4_TIGCA|nr:hypothetical protein TCAL_15754 [Tigriopus californicus]
MEINGNPMPVPQTYSDLDYYPDSSGGDNLDDYAYGSAGANPAQQESDIPRDEDGNYIVGDMILSPEQYKADFLGEDLRSGIRGDKYRWPGGIIPYRMDGTLTSSERRDVVGSIGRFNKIMAGCLKIREAFQSESAYVKVHHGRGGCGYSSVGRQGSSQTLSISGGCFTDDTILHEFIHAFGFYHEQSRPDRDQYVTIVTENISPSNRNNFNLRVNDLTFNVPYDGLSIMHYSSKAFSRNGKDTIISKIPGVPTSRLGRGDKMTKLDILKLKRMYGCSETSEPTTEIPTIKPINPTSPSSSTESIASILGLLGSVIDPDQVQSGYDTGDYTSFEGDYGASSQAGTGEEYVSVGSSDDYY